MAKASKSRASKQGYISPQQLTLSGFESPFSHHLLSTNRWVILAHSILWDSLVSTYQRQLGNQFTGAGNINPRVAIGVVIIKHLCDISDRETILQIQENMYMQYFIGYSSFSNEAPFDASLFVDIRKRLTLEHINEINEKILGIMAQEDAGKNQGNQEHKDEGTLSGEEPVEKSHSKEGVTDQINDSSADIELAHEGSLLMDATACPQDIAYPTDLNLLNDAREKSEELIDELQVGLTTPKPRTYREIARKKYLQTAQKKKKRQKEIRKAIRQQLQYVKRNIKSILDLLAYYEGIPPGEKQYKYLLVIQTLYDQQKYMYD
jgi:transposase, IS5 family